MYPVSVASQFVHGLISLFENGKHLSYRNVKKYKSVLSPDVVHHSVQLYSG